MFSLYKDLCTHVPFKKKLATNNLYSYCDRILLLVVDSLMFLKLFYFIGSKCCGMRFMLFIKMTRTYNFVCISEHHAILARIQDWDERTSF